jgi:hypothetical protein
MAARPAQHGQGTGLHGCQLQSPQPLHTQQLHIAHPRNDCATGRGSQGLLHRPQDLRRPGDKQPLKVNTSGRQRRRIGLMRRGHHHQPGLRRELLKSNECRQQHPQLAYARPIDQELNQALGQASHPRRAAHRGQQSLSEWPQSWLPRSFPRARLRNSQATHRYADRCENPWNRRTFISKRNSLHSPQPGIKGDRQPTTGHHAQPMD